MSIAFDAEASAKIEMLRRQFVERMKGDAGFIQSLFEPVGPESAADSEIGSLRKICHSLCGAAGVFGYPVVAQAASRMSAAFASGERNRAGLAPLARALVGEIHRAAADS